MADIGAHRYVTLVGNGHEVTGKKADKSTAYGKGCRIVHAYQFLPRGLKSSGQAKEWGYNHSVLDEGVDKFVRNPVQSGLER